MPRLPNKIGGKAVIAIHGSQFSNILRTNFASAVKQTVDNSRLLQLDTVGKDRAVATVVVIALLASRITLLIY